MAGDGEAGAHSCFSTVVVGEHQPVGDGDEQGLAVKLGFIILVVGKMGGDGDDGGSGLAVQEAAEQSEIVVRAVRQGIKGGTMLLGDVGCWHGSRLRGEGAQVTVLRPWALRPTAAGDDLLPAGAKYWVNSQSWKHSTAPFANRQAARPSGARSLPQRRPVRSVNSDPRTPLTASRGGDPGAAKAPNASDAQAVETGGITIRFRCERLRSTPCSVAPRETPVNAMPYGSLRGT